MLLKNYLRVTGISIAKLAEVCDINPNTMRAYVERIREPSISNALKIVNATHGAVNLIDLIPDSKKENQE